jgi:hypothetical protein
MERTYAVLLDAEARIPERRYHRSIGDPFTGAPACLFSAPPQPVIRREHLTAPELVELSREPDFVAAAEVMSTKLHSPPVEEPVRGRDAAEQRPGRPWGIACIGADRCSCSGVGVSVGILDTGIDAGHAAFRGMDLVERDFTGEGNGDAIGHGTHCAGIVFGRDVAGQRIGVAPMVPKALVAKVIGHSGGDTDMLLRGLQWAHSQRARVVLLAIGLDFERTVQIRVGEGWPENLAVLRSLEAFRANLHLMDCLLNMYRLQETLNGGMVVVAAAGNDSRRDGRDQFIVPAALPASADALISVAALDPDPSGGGYRTSAYSNCGVTFAAPGSRILSARPGGGLTESSGTGGAAAHVAGAAALWWEAVQDADLPSTATSVRARMSETAGSNGLAPGVLEGDRGLGRISAPSEEAAAAARRSKIVVSASRTSERRIWPGHEPRRRHVEA